MTAQVAADLRAAADVLRRNGWTQGDYTGTRGCCCLVGAVAKVLGGETESDIPAANHRRREALRRALNAQVGGASDCWFDVIDWNDEYGRTADEVIAALEAAADAAEAQQ